MKERCKIDVLYMSYEVGDKVKKWKKEGGRGGTRGERRERRRGRKLKIIY